jgi:hypothetical protein
MKNTHRLLLSVGLVSACAVSLVGCGAAATPTPPAPTAASAVPASSVAAPSATASPVAAVGETCTPIKVKFDPKATGLTGTWAGDDGGVYYVRQLGKVVWWNGMSGRDLSPENLGRDWNNVGRGEIKADLTIVSDWLDVPRGGVEGYGTVTFKIGPDAAGNLQITKTSETGTGRGDTVWTPCKAGF